MLVISFLFGLAKLGFIVPLYRAGVWHLLTVTTFTADSTSSCFGVRRDGHVYTAEGCCDVRRHGPGGNINCWGYDEDIQMMTSFEICCVQEALGGMLLADRPPLIVDLVIDLHSNPGQLWADARKFCAHEETSCRHAEVYFTGLQIGVSTGKLEPRVQEAWNDQELTRVFLDVGAHVKSRYLERLDKETDALLIAFEPDRASCKYQEAYAKRTLSENALKRFWLLPAAIGPALGLSVLHRANQYFDGQCSSLLEFRVDAVAWDGCTTQTGQDVVSTMPLSDILGRLPESVVHIELKVDVQGFDLQAILSAGDEINRVSQITVEVQDLPQEDLRVRYVGQRSRAEIDRTLSEKGFALGHCDPYDEQSSFIKETDCHYFRKDLNPPSMTDGSMHLVTLADGEPFESSQRRLDETAGAAGFASHVPWNFERLYARVGDGLQNPLSDIESGSFIPFNSRWWKPFVILDMLQNASVQDGDWVVYQDSSKYVPKGFTEEHNILLKRTLASMKGTDTDALLGSILPTSLGWEWAQRCHDSYSLSPEEWRDVTADDMMEFLRGVLERLGICGIGDETCCATVRSRPMVQNAWMIFRKSDASISFVHEWLRWNVDVDVMRAMPFADQSLFELLAHRAVHSIKAKVVVSNDFNNTGGLEKSQLVNNLKHLGFVLEQLRGPTRVGSAELMDLSAAQLAQWHESIVSSKAWGSSLCSIPVT